MFSEVISYKTTAQGLYMITDQIAKLVERSNIENGMCNIFVLHTSCSLCIQENHDPDARHDLEQWIKDHVPFSDKFKHIEEGEDDMPSHIKSAITNVCLTIPVIDRKLAMGQWQGIYLWEHRDGAHKRSMRISIWD
ncbi:MAG: secondary thiamine-phosphate synthase enzyme YjbQ [bacterium]|nr:secondary thiamine-phosphate synthase enzyme YjbQ [bacterium]